MIADIVKSGLIVGAFIVLSWLIFQNQKIIIIANKGE